MARVRKTCDVIWNVREPEVSNLLPSVANRDASQLKSKKESSCVHQIEHPSGVFP